MDYTPLFEAGIDYFTMTGKGGKPSLELARLGSDLLSDEYKAGNEYRGWGMAGFNGFKCGHAQLGERGKEVIIRVSGPPAAIAFKECYEHADTISRIDTQFTLRTSVDAPTIIKRCYRSAKRLRDSRRTLGCVSIIQSTDRSSTIYLNRRASDMFGRIYDKGRESRLDHYRDAVRFEIEWKGRKAQRVAQQLYEAASPQYRSYQLTRGVLEKRAALAAVCAAALPGTREGCDLQIARTNEPLRRSVTLCTRRYKWLSTSVRPTVDLFRKHGRLQEVYEALGLEMPIGANVQPIDLTALDAERSM